MGKLVKLLIVVAIIAVAAYGIIQYTNSSSDQSQSIADQVDKRPRLEEQYGFTTETVDDQAP
jgi:flagellar basal body-associated protein FliL